MCKARFTEHQTITLRKSVEAGRTVKDACHEVQWSTKTGHSFRVFPVSVFRFVWW